MRCFGWLSGAKHASKHLQERSHVQISKWENSPPRPPTQPPRLPLIPVWEILPEDSRQGVVEALIRIVAAQLAAPADGREVPDEKP